MLTGKKVVVGISGGIAAYKACDIVSWLHKNGADVRVIMTESACKFVSPLTLQTLSGKPVYTDLFAQGSDYQVVHIEACAGADLFVVAPATGNIMAKMAAGIADEVLSAALLAASCPIMLAPAMHVDMYESPATVRNLQTLQSWGCTIIEPASGRLACGAIGKGRLAEVADIMQAIEAALLQSQDLVGKKILVTAGPTREALDPVRYLTNKSSGRMGYAVACAARARGAQVTLVSGPVNLPAPNGVELISVTSASEMLAAVMQHYADTDIVIKSAAVADYAPKVVAQNKLKKQGTALTLELVPTVDILKTLGEQKTHQILVGFAAETTDLVTYAKRKVQEKNLDLIVANDVTQAHAGFDVDTNIITIIDKKGEECHLPEMSKLAAAHCILDRVAALCALADK